MAVPSDNYSFSGQIFEDMGEFNNQFYLKVKHIQALREKATKESYLNYFLRVNEAVNSVIKDGFSCKCVNPTSENQDLVKLFFVAGLDQNEVVYCAQNLGTDMEQLLQVRPLNQSILQPICKKSLLCLEDKSITSSLGRV